MSARPASGPLLTLEPLLAAIREGVEGAGWRLSGLQKTTSHEFEGRWKGESTRSAYLFFHSEDAPEGVSVDVFLDETSRGLRGNLALAVDGRDLGELGDAGRLLQELGKAAGETLIEGYSCPVTLRLRLADHDAPVEEAESEVRFKIKLPAAALEAGHGAVSALGTASTRAFEALLGHPAVRGFSG